ncbi:unnamed protein product [Adineta steineri]|uniref:Uncharacterized protein n=1 Tax=Adineta steineri TaxID=433720 RepID=A0A816CSD3_9BILA|nr:unnamed protein product [Adineta steineri]CAF1627378.1 unnamed protein product [Adineta steineri]
MKRTITTITNSNNANIKANLSLEGIVVAVTAILDSQITKHGKYWTALVCDSNQNLNRIAKYLSSKTNCSLHPKIIEYLNNQNGIKLNKLKFSGDNMYTASNETIAAPKVVTFTPTCTQISTINDIQSMSDGQYVSYMCKIIDIGPLCYESTIIGIITSIGLVDETFSCPKCYSTDIERNYKTIRCNTCKSRSLYLKQSNQNQIQLTITDVKQNIFELIVDTPKITSLLQECNHDELSTQDLVKQESVLLVLSSITVVVNFNPINKHITNIVTNNNNN